MKCQHCGTKEILPFKCPYCNGYFCAEHRLPENHECPEIWRARAPREAVPRVTVENKTPYEYKVTFGPRPTSETFWFSATEIKHLTISILIVMAVGFSIFLWSPRLVNILKNYPEILVVSSLVFALAFLFHEVAHKLIAQHYGLWAEFRLIMFGVLLTLISIVSPFFKIISPGAVMIAGFADKDTVGKTAVAGPTTNLVFAITSLVLYEYLSLQFYSLSVIALFSTIFNAWIALINLIPFGMLDGWKIFQWNKIVWIIVLIPSIALTIISFPLLESL